MFRPPYVDSYMGGQLDYLGIPQPPPTDSSWTSWTDDIPLCVHTGGVLNIRRVGWTLYSKFLDLIVGLKKQV